MPATQKKPQGIQGGSLPERILKNGLLHSSILLLTAIWMLPVLGLFVNSFRPALEMSDSGWWTALVPPYNFSLENYFNVLFQTAGMGRSFLNSLLIAVPSTLMPILVAAYAAYAIAWLEFKGKIFIFIVIIGLLVVPLQMALVPLLKLYTTIDLIGTFYGIWLAHAAFGLPFSVYLLRNFFGTLPQEMFEAACIDGASHPQIFFRILLPTSGSGLGVLVIFQFLWVYNDLLLALVFLGGSPDVAPMPVTISNMLTSYGQNWEKLTSASFISILLPLIIFLSLQRFFVRGITAGSVKG
jgi:alpha-glucoside transport system permease protein